jgi:hypothetical protein
MPEFVRPCRHHSVNLLPTYQVFVEVTDVHLIEDFICN